jgi:TetR/AcrR family transcriptional regulator, regulator of cefoperazone and chloramphenicol sensitivity
VSVARPKRRVRLSADERSQQIVATAFDALAEHGFEGFRTRDIADRLGINSATLHHHFATKDDLIAAVADELVRRFQTERAPQTEKPLAAIDAFERQLADAIYYRTKRPALIAVYREFVARAPRDPHIAALVAHLDETWRQDLRQTLEQASTEHRLKPGIDCEIMSGLLLHVLWGLVTSPADARYINQACRQLQAMVMAPD